MDLNDLFGFESGIYSNASRHGRDWERPCSLELIHPSGKTGFQVNCGVRLRGGFSRSSSNPKHALRFLFRKTYGAGKLQYPLFGDSGAKEFDNVDLRTSQNYSWSFGGDPRAVFLRDQFSRDTQIEMKHPGVRGDFYHLYINGLYWGLYNSCERPEASYAASYFGGKKRQYDVIKRQGSDLNAGFFRTRDERDFRWRIEATDGNMDAWKRLWESSRSGLVGRTVYQSLLGRNPDGTSAGLETLLDPVSLIDYMLVIFYGGNLDSPVLRDGRGPNNWYGIRNREGGDGFRYVIWDAEHTLLDPDTDRTGPFTAGMLNFPTSNPQYIWQQCLDNEEFRLLIADRVHLHFFNEGALTASASRQRFARRVHEIESAVIAESARWGDRRQYSFYDGRQSGSGPLNRDDHWRPEVDRILNEYLPVRGDIVLEQLWAHGLIPDLFPPVFHRHGGTLAPSSRLKVTEADPGIRARS